MVRVVRKKLCFIYCQRLGRKMTNKQILEIALQQSAYDCNCSAADFALKENVVTISRANPKARRYMPLPLECDLVSYGNNIVAQVSERTKSSVAEYINKFGVSRCFETPQINILNDLLSPLDLKICFMAQYFMPDVTQLKELECGYDLYILQLGKHLKQGRTLNYHLQRQQLMEKTFLLLLKHSDFWNLLQQ